MAYAQIDWHDFVVVETVLFNEADDQAALPAPTSLSDLQSASLEQKGMMSLQPHNMRIEEAMPTDEDGYYNAYAPQQTMQPPPVPVFPQEQEDGAGIDFQTQTPIQEDEDEQRIRERTEERERAQQAHAAAKGGAGPMRIRNDYVPRAQAKRQNVQMASCPNCKQQIPYDEMHQHMRSKSLHRQYHEF